MWMWSVSETLRLDHGQMTSTHSRHTNRILLAPTLLIATLALTACMPGLTRPVASDTNPNVPLGSVPAAEREAMNIADRWLEYLTETRPEDAESAAEMIAAFTTSKLRDLSVEAKRTAEPLPDNVTLTKTWDDVVFVSADGSTALFDGCLRGVETSTSQVNGEPVKSSTFATPEPRRLRFLYSEQEMKLDGIVEDAPSRSCE